MQERYGVMYRNTEEGVEFHYEGVKGTIIPFTPVGLKKALRYISESDPWKLWADRKILKKDFCIEIIN